MAATKFSFFDISTSDRGDFPRIIEIALFIYLLPPATIGRNSKIEKQEFTVGGSTGQTPHLGPKSQAIC